MVRVYLARSLEEGRDHEAQSRRARQLLEMALKRDYPQIRTPVRLKKETNGKPFLADYPGIYISLSHSGPYAACAVADGPVGIDVEARRPRRSFERVVQKLHPQERAALEQAEGADRETLFYNLWVLKESFIKADGRGLGIPLNSFCMEAKVGEVLRIKGGIWGRDCFYRLYRLEGENCSLGVCALDSEIAGEPVWITISSGFFDGGLIE